MIDLYTWTTPNGRKVSIALEELGLDYEVHPIDIGKDEQFAPDFLKISPNNKIPAIVERDTGFHLMESGAILLWLAEREGKLIENRWVVIEWLMWQMGGAGPMLGQAHHFLRFNPGKAPYAEDRYGTEAKRLYGVLDRRLEGREFIADSYSIADIATWPWISRFEWQGIDMNEFPNVRDWYCRIAARPAVQRGYDQPRKTGEIPLP
ncbi:MAG: glutathione S-transferase family protein [Silicimonas sp.]|nr:glutathione S-transferase family protein [Silicimonas sp.]MBT8425598.1 glutathione S-transferase family protein [Silicimonas sp.]NNL36076.1 glutathione S-transferase family protein [Silicimonas sp.]NNL72127.1 glutathione S-transferase family protein [Silicimonas sp.]